MKRLLPHALLALLIGTTAAIAFAPAAFADIIIVAPRRGRHSRHFDRRFDSRFDRHFDRRFDSRFDRRFDRRGVSRRQFKRDRFRRDPYFHSPRGRTFIRDRQFRQHRPFRSRSGRVFIHR